MDSKSSTSFTHKRINGMCTMRIFVDGPVPLTVLGCCGQVKLVTTGCLDCLLRIAMEVEAEDDLALCLSACLNLSTNSANQVRNPKS